MKTQYAVMAFIEAQEVDEDGDVHVCTTAKEAVTLGCRDALDEASSLLFHLQHCAERHGGKKTEEEDG